MFDVCRNTGIQEYKVERRKGGKVEMWKNLKDLGNDEGMTFNTEGLVRRS